MTFRNFCDIYPMILIYESIGMQYTLAVNQTTPKEDIIMKKLMKSVLFTRTRRENQSRPDTGKTRCYACVNGIVIPVL